MNPFSINNISVFYTRSLFILFYLAIMLGLPGGCAMTPKKLLVEDLSESFEAGVILSGRTGRPVSFEALSEQLSASRIIYVGEQHKDASHHKIQLKIIQAVLEKHPKMAVGMEMFDRSYQHVLDMWSAGELDQKHFIRKVHWYANWRYRFSLYSEILNFIQENQIRLVGLNIPFHIPPKIRVGGIENLRDEERSYLPEEIDTSNDAHKDYLREVFAQHGFGGMVEFDDFYAAQCVWEDAMAEAIYRNLNDDVMVVLAGNGHIQYKYGIPERAFRRTGVPFLTIYPAQVGGKVELNIADFIWATQ